jgi:hypothetical protein
LFLVRNLVEDPKQPTRLGHNRVPNAQSGLTPLELITKERSDYREILRCHVWECPVYVLEAKLQNDQKLPKWNRRARLGQFVGFSDEHSSMVSNVRHLTTGYIYLNFMLYLMTYLKQ